jgi:hypothetical protein
LKLSVLIEEAGNGVKIRADSLANGHCVHVGCAQQFVVLWGLTTKVNDA